MRLVLEHPFFTGGNLPRNPDARDATTPNSLSSTPTNRSFSTSAGSRDTRSSARDSTSLPNRHYLHGADPPEVKAANSRESIENRVNFVKKGTTSSRVSEQQSSPSDTSSRSGRSFGSGFRNRLKTSLRRPNVA
jgi:hypothetical protein